MQKPVMLSLLAEKVAQCTKCQDLVDGRIQTVFGEGNPDGIAFLGEAPGRSESEQGKPFVGKAGELLTNIIRAIGLDREQVYILNALKCRPPNNRTPKNEEISNCRPFLELQLKIIKPRCICCLGGVAAKALLELDSPIGSLRQQVFQYNNSKVVCTYHPSYVIRSKTNAELCERKQAVLADMQLLLSLIK